MSSHDRIVLGAGVSGLLAAKRAVDRGEHVLVVEREERTGGILKAMQFAHLTVDAGAEAFSVITPKALELFAEIGLADDIVYPERTDARILYSDSLRYRIPHGVLGIPESLDDPELRHIMSETTIQEARRRDALPLRPVGGTTVAELVSERLGDEFVMKLVDPVVTGVHGSSATVLDACATLPAVVAALPTTGSLCGAVAHVRRTLPRPGAAVASIRGGLHRVAQALTTHLEQAGVPILLGQTDVELDHLDQEWMLTSRGGRFSSKFLTIATGGRGFPGSVSRALGVENERHADAAVDVALVLALVESVQLNEFPVGSGALVSHTHGLAAKATTHLNAKWHWIREVLAPNTHLLRLSFGRSGVLPEEDLRHAARRELHALYNVSDARVLDLRIVRWSDALSKPSPQNRDDARRLVSAAEQLGVEVCSPLVTGNGLLGIITDHYRRNAA